MTLTKKQCVVKVALGVGYGYSKFLCIDHIYQSEKRKRTLEKLQRLYIQGLVFSLLLSLSRLT